PDRGTVWERAAGDADADQRGNLDDANRQPNGGNPDDSYLDSHDHRDPGSYRDLDGHAHDDRDPCRRRDAEFLAAGGLRVERPDVRFRARSVLGWRDGRRPGKRVVSGRRV